MTMIMPNFQRKFGKRKMVRQGKFNPDREFVKDAVEYYLKWGGEITKIEVDEMSDMKCYAEVDEFLQGG